MAKCKIEQGGVYTHSTEVFAREVIEITPFGDVIYDDYGLSDGAPMGRKCRCSLGAFARWAARQVTSDEDRVLRRDEGHARDLARMEMITHMGIAAASDELIRREFYRRGLDRIGDSGPLSRVSDGGEERSGTGVSGSPSRRGGRSKKPRNAGSN
jgi:hypothetical protein